MTEPIISTDGKTTAYPVTVLVEETAGDKERTPGYMRFVGCNESFTMRLMDPKRFNRMKAIQGLGIRGIRYEVKLANGKHYVLIDTKESWYLMAMNEQDTELLKNFFAEHGIE